MNSIPPIWDRLQIIRNVRFVSKGMTPGWGGYGQGNVNIKALSTESFVLSESGKWKPTNGTEIIFNNVFRWTLALPDQINLEHLRLGPDNPVFLLGLKPDANNIWGSREPHICGQDSYFADMRLRNDELLINWEIIGPFKQQRVEYVYT